MNRLIVVGGSSFRLRNVIATEAAERRRRRRRLSSRSRQLRLKAQRRVALRNAVELRILSVTVERTVSVVVA